jgi:hypothetical protein
VVPPRRGARRVVAPGGRLRAAVPGAGPGGTLPRMMGERRCPTCGALASAEAEWCGQCFAPLDRAGAPTEVEGVAGSSPVATAGPKAIPGTTGGSIEVEGGMLAWTCPACETRNPIEANECSVCGTPFGRLLAEPTTAPEIEPQPRPCGRCLAGLGTGSSGAGPTRSRGSRCSAGRSVPCWSSLCRGSARADSGPPSAVHAVPRGLAADLHRLGAGRLPPSGRRAAVMSSRRCCGRRRA